jgi:hypothetical protein
MTVVDLKPKRARRSRSLPMEQATGAAKFFDRMVREIEGELGGRRQLTRIQLELIRAFAGGATVLKYSARPARSIFPAMRRSPAPCCASARGSGLSAGRRM